MDNGVLDTGYRSKETVLHKTFKFPDYEGIAMSARPPFLRFFDGNEPPKRHYCKFSV